MRVLAGFAFALAHGVSAAVALRLRGERELERIRALLDLSQSSAGVMYASLMVLLVALLAIMYVRATPYYGALRRASGLAYFDGRRGHEAEPANVAELRTLLTSARAIELTTVGYLGLVVILWLMFFKPF